MEAAPYGAANDATTMLRLCYDQAMSSDAISSLPPGSLPVSEKLALAAEALETYRTSCFWSLAPDFRVTESTVPLIVAGLRRHGDRQAFQLAASLCH